MSGSLSSLGTGFGFGTPNVSKNAPSTKEDCEAAGGRWDEADQICTSYTEQTDNTVWYIMAAVVAVLGLFVILSD